MNEYVRLHQLIETQAEEIRLLIAQRKDMQLEITRLEGEAITLREQMAKDFVTIQQQKLTIGELNGVIQFMDLTKK